MDFKQKNQGSKQEVPPTPARVKTSTISQYPLTRFDTEARHSLTLRQYKAGDFPAAYPFYRDWTPARSDRYTMYVTAILDGCRPLASVLSISAPSLNNFATSSFSPCLQPSTNCDFSPSPIHAYCQHEFIRIFFKVASCKNPSYQLAQRVYTLSK